MLFVASKAAGPQRRLFYERRETDSWRPGLFLIRPVVDSQGNWLFFDRNFNYLVVVVTNDPNRISGFNDLEEMRGVLFQGAPCETAVVGKQNTLEIAVSSTERELFDIGTGDAERIYNAARSSDRASSIFDALSQSFDGADARRLDTLLNELRASRAEQAAEGQSHSGSGP